MKNEIFFSKNVLTFLLLRVESYSYSAFENNFYNYFFTKAVVILSKFTFEVPLMVSN